MAKYEVRMTMLVAVSVEVEADNEEQAEKRAMEKTAREEAYYLQHYDSIWEREVTGVNECEDDPADEVYAAYGDTMVDAVRYVNRHLEPEDKAIICAMVDKNFKQHMNPAYGIDDGKIIDLLEEYGADHDLPEGWYLEEYDADDIVLLIQFES